MSDRLKTLLADFAVTLLCAFGLAVVGSWAAYIVFRCWRAIL
jgi:hypothetical protein